MAAFQFDQLQTLVVLVDEGTFEAAARRLSVSASAVSQRIKAMEQTAGQILIRRTNPVQATPAGDVVLRLARQVRLLESDAAAELRQGTLTAGRISLPLAVNADSLATWFLDALAEVDASFDIHREDEQHSIQLLRSGAVMAAVTATAQPVQGCSVYPLGRMRYRAVCSPRFAARWLPGNGLAQIGLEQLAEVPVVVFDRKDDLQHRFFRAGVGRELGAPRHYVPASNEFAQAVRLGLGWGLLPEQQCLTDLAGGTLLQLKPDAPVDVALYWQRWNLASPLLDEVSRAIRSAAKSRLYAA